MGPYEPRTLAASILTHYPALIVVHRVQARREVFAIYLDRDQHGGRGAYDAGDGDASEGADVDEALDAVLTLAVVQDGCWWSEAGTIEDVRDARVSRP